jgi:hypothetical protein
MYEPDQKLLVHPAMIPVCRAPSDQSTDMAFFALELQREKEPNAITIGDAQVNGSSRKQDNIKNATISSLQINATAYLPTAPTTTAQAICAGSRPSIAIIHK